MMRSYHFSVHFVYMPELPYQGGRGTAHSPPDRVLQGRPAKEKDTTQVVTRAVTRAVHVSLVAM